ncbi:HAD hydrolase family protein [uncultured Rikenella sp.]|uniref:KdsC family phosphatase n=1 Tax=uncultured Rikenella sp. TaxID=368003 RepID=UPI00260179CC|nr:HAD hydrolase family protein [uncultured Rikenella sp.]
MGNFKEEIAKIRAFVFDVDGVFTDGRILITPEGEFLREYSMRDGLAVVRAVEKGYPIGIISGGRGDQLRKRMEGLGIRHIYTGQDSKIESLHHFSEQCGVPLHEMIYMGDDYPDIEPMRAVRLAAAPADAADAVKGMVHYVSAFDGGRGCVRDMIEQVLRARGDWFEI